MRNSFVNFLRKAFSTAGFSLLAVAVLAEIGWRIELPLYTAFIAFGLLAASSLPGPNANRPLKALPCQI
jgi:hypothetical protein